MGCLGYLLNFNGGLHQMSYTSLNSTGKIYGGVSFTGKYYRSG